MTRSIHGCKIYSDHTVVCNTCGLIGEGRDRGDAATLAYTHKGRPGYTIQRTEKIQS